jgi:acetyl esterase
VNYRLAPEHPFPAALEDTWNALDWIAANADWIGIDKDQIAIAGDSAGGNLAAVTAIAARDGSIAFKPQFQLLIYPGLDLTASQPSHAEFAEGYLLTRDLYAWYRQNYVGSFPDPTDWHLSPLFAEELRGVAPAIVLYAGFDPLRDEAVVYSARLLDAGVGVKPIFFPGMIHGFLTMGKVIPAANVAIRRIADAIDELLYTPSSGKQEYAGRPSLSSFDARVISAHLQMQGDI